MQYQFRRARVVVGVAVAAAGALALSGVAQASDDSGRLGPTTVNPVPAPSLHLTDVPNANTKAPGVTSPNLLSPELAEVATAQGSTKLENGTAAVPYYGYDGDGPLLPAPGDLPTATHKVEASKTEPDKNTYLRLRNQHGADPSYDYGTRFLFQGSPPPTSTPRSRTSPPRWVGVATRASRTTRPAS